MSNIEQTLSIIKPDAVERNLENEIKDMFIDNGFLILREKKIQIEKSEAEKFYNQKKYRLPKMRLQNFIKFINLNLFMMNYVLTFHPAL